MSQTSMRKEMVISDLSETPQGPPSSPPLAFLALLLKYLDVPFVLLSQHG